MNDDGDEDRKSCKNFPCCVVSKKILFWEAAVIFAIGSILCLYLSSKWFLFCYRKSNEMITNPIIIGLICGIVGGLLQGYFIFCKLFNRNVTRILALNGPRLHNCFSLRFYIFFAIFDSLCIILTNLYVKSVEAAVTVGSILLMVSIGLLWACLTSPWQYTRFTGYKKLLLLEGDTDVGGQERCTIRINAEEVQSVNADSRAWASAVPIASLFREPPISNLPPRLLWLEMATNCRNTPVVVSDQ